jgi:hypothetical protein
MNDRGLLPRRIRVAFWLYRGERLGDDGGLARTKWKRFLINIVVTHRTGFT